jgi:hypothetical protein
MTKDERAKELADRIRAAIRKDQIAIAAQVIRSRTDLTRSNLAKELRDIGLLLDDLIHVQTKAALAESDKKWIAEEIGRKLGLRRPEIVWIAPRGASAQNFLAVLNEIEAILTETKS